MLKNRGFSALQKRNIYIPASASSKARHRPPHVRPKKSQIVDSHADETATRKEALLLDQQLKELRQKQAELRQKISKAQDQDLQKALAKQDGSNLIGDASANEIEELDSQLQNLSITAPRSVKNSDLLADLPKSIRTLLKIGDNEVNKKPRLIQLFAPKNTATWPQIVEKLPVLPENVPTKDVERFVSMIPLHQRSCSLYVLERIIPSSLRTQFVKDLFMAAYADQRNPHKVAEILKTSSTPSVYSYGHLVKALFRVKSAPDQILSVMKEMSNKHGLEPSLPVMSTAIQSLIQHRRYGEAESLFDNLKYWSVSTQPDLKLYNSMILCAAKQHNVNRALDLLEEMKTRRPHPLAPNAETYNYIVYACSRKRETQLTAWNMFLEAQAQGFAPDRRTFQSLLYLCGNSGELMLARALVRNISAKSLSFVDDFVLNSLMNCYANWKPGPSPISASETGRSIRAGIMMNDNFRPNSITADTSEPQIPFLPLAQLDKRLVLLESRAVMDFFAEHQPSALRVTNFASSATFPVIYNYLKVAIELGDSITEFKNRFAQFTRIELPLNDANADRILEVEPDLSESTELVTECSEHAVKRDEHIYRLALQAAIRFRDLQFGREVWTERGQWRRLSPKFQSQSTASRNQNDFLFARDLVELLAVCGRVEEAILLVKSTTKLSRWRRHHLTSLIGVCERTEDVANLKRINRILR